MTLFNQVEGLTAFPILKSIIYILSLNGQNNQSCTTFYWRLKFLPCYLNKFLSVDFKM